MSPKLHLKFHNIDVNRTAQSAQNKEMISLWNNFFILFLFVHNTDIANIFITFPINDTVHKNMPSNQNAKELPILVSKTSSLLILEYSWSNYSNILKLMYIQQVVVVVFAKLPDYWIWKIIDIFLIIKQKMLAWS